MKIVVMGASAGGVVPLQRVVANLEPSFGGAILVVLHVPANRISSLPQILSKAGKLPASHAIEGEEVLPGRIYVAPPGHHILMREDGLQLTRGPRENLQRPAIDPLFRTAARAFGADVIGVVLSGSGSDGATGLRMIKSAGGTTIVQRPGDCIYPAMPLKALEVTNVDWTLDAEEIGPLLSRLVERPSEKVPSSITLTEEADAEEEDLAFRVKEELPKDQCVVHGHASMVRALFPFNQRRCILLLADLPEEIWRDPRVMPFLPVLHLRANDF